MLSVFLLLQLLADAVHNAVPHHASEATKRTPSLQACMAREVCRRGCRVLCKMQKYFGGRRSPPLFGERGCKLVSGRGYIAGSN
jgi:hypothetical protein